MADDPIKVLPPKPEIAKRAHIGSMEEYERLYRLSLDEPETFWAQQAERLCESEVHPGGALWSGLVSSRSRA